jgi:DNA-directed RNA polymerase subunit alpha
MRLSTRGAKIVTAGDIEVPSDVEIINVEQPIATLDSDDANLEIEFTVERGSGYSSADYRENMPIGVIPVDAIYTPIPRVNYVVEHTRVGQQTDYDRLVLEVWTDGSIDPGEAISQSAQILKRHSEIIADFNKEPAPPADGKLPDTNVDQKTFEVPIEDLNLSVRTYNCLKRSNITKVGQILVMDEKDLLSVRNFGRKSYDELRQQLINHNFMSANQPIGPFSGSGFGDADEEGDGDPAAVLDGLGDNGNNDEEQ